jgi:hypothetical protein
VPVRVRQRDHLGGFMDNNKDIRITFKDDAELYFDSKFDSYTLDNNFITITDENRKVIFLTSSIKKIEIIEEVIEEE